MAQCRMVDKIAHNPINCSEGPLTDGLCPAHFERLQYLQIKHDQEALLPRETFSIMWRQAESVYPKLQHLTNKEFQFVSQYIGIAMGVVSERSGKR